MKIAIILTALDKASGVVNSTVGKITKSLDKVAKITAIAGAAGTLFFGKAIQAAEESEVAQARLSQVFKSMGQDYKKATAASADYASALQTQIGFEDETIMAVQAKIATFEKASNALARSNGIYERATAAAFDMQAAGFGDASNNAVQLGKALQDPLTGINALRRSGITFTDAEKKKIAALVKSNQLFKAQDIVMKAIEKQVGGVAKATATTSQKMKIAWGEVMEKIGYAVLPMFLKFSNFMLNKVIPTVQSFIDKHPKLVRWLAIASVSLLAIGTIAKVISISISLLSGSFSLLSGAISFVGRTIVFVGRLFLGNPILLAIGLIAAGVYLIIKHWSKIKAFFSKLWGNVKEIFMRAWHIMLNIMLAPLRAMIFLWNKISSFFSNLWTGIKDTASTAWQAIGDALIAPIKWIQEKWEALLNWFKRTFEKIKGWITDVFGGPQAQFEKAMQKKIESDPQFKAAFEAKYAPSIKTANTFTRMAPAFSSIAQTNPAAALPLPASNNNTSSTVVHLNYSPSISGTGDANVDLKKNANDLVKILNEQMRKNDRKKF